MLIEPLFAVPYSVQNIDINEVGGGGGYTEVHFIICSTVLDVCNFP